VIDQAHELVQRIPVAPAPGVEEPIDYHVVHGETFRIAMGGGVQGGVRLVHKLFEPGRLLAALWGWQEEIFSNETDSTSGGGHAGPRFGERSEGGGLPERRL
jgi:hypothetical protein